MAMTSTLARKWRIDVNTGTTGSPTWTQVFGISDLKPAIDSNTEDDSDYESDGWGSSAITMRTWSIETKFMRKVDVDDGTYDTGQEAMRAASDQFGADAVVEVRWYDRDGGPEAYTGFAQVEWSPDGGSASALDSATVTLRGQGARTAITNPAA